MKQIRPIRVEKRLPIATWDAQIEDDLKSGKLNTLLDEVNKDLKDGRCDPLDATLKSVEAKQMER